MIYYCCSECEYDFVLHLAALFVCPYCMADRCHRVIMDYRVAKDDDKPEGFDARKTRRAATK